MSNHNPSAWRTRFVIACIATIYLAAAGRPLQLVIAPFLLGLLVELVLAHFWPAAVRRRASARRHQGHARVRASTLGKVFAALAESACEGPFDDDGFTHAHGLGRIGSLSWHHLHDDMHGPGRINPASGLPMMGAGIDVAGNPFGTDRHHRHTGSIGLGTGSSLFDDGIGGSSIGSGIHRIGLGTGSSLFDDGIGGSSIGGGSHGIGLGTGSSLFDDHIGGSSIGGGIHDIGSHIGGAGGIGGHDW